MKNFFSVDYKSKKNIDVEAIAFGIEKMYPVDSDKMHVHDFSQLTIVTKGNALLYSNGCETGITEGDVFVINSYTPHTLKEIHNLEAINVLFYQKML